MEQIEELTSVILNTKEELYDVIAALADTIRSLKNEIVELQGIYLQTNSTRKLLPGQTKLGVVN